MTREMAVASDIDTLVVAAMPASVRHARGARARAALAGKDGGK